MFPIVIDLTRIPVLLAGNGELVLRRLAYLDEAKAARVTVFCEHASEELKQTAGSRLIQRNPGENHIKGHAVIMLAGYERVVAEPLVKWAHVHGKLVNVEDVTDLCDFYFTASVRRGDLVIAVSTSGASPTLARKVRDVIAERFGVEWAERVRILSDMRKSLKAHGAGMQEIIEKTEQYLIEKGWLAKEVEKV
jgi:siroheme synthase-like protein